MAVVSGSLAGPVRAYAVLAALAFFSSAGPASNRYRIDIEQLEYRPPEIQIVAGDTVVWYNRDIVPHTVTLPDDDERRDTVAPGDSIAIVLQEPGTRRYYCRFHPTMTGVLQVRLAAGVGNTEEMLE